MVLMPIFALWLLIFGPFYLSHSKRKGQNGAKKQPIYSNKPELSCASERNDFQRKSKRFKLGGGF
jgi:hypothetical protein